MMPINKKTVKNYDLIIIGGAAAGLSAAIYTARRGLKTLIVSKDLGGQAAITAEIENYPGVPLSHGLALMKSFLDQAKSFGADFVFDEVISLKPKNKDWGIKTRKAAFSAQAVILAHGLTPSNLNVPGEDKLFGHGVQYSPADNAEVYQGKTVVVVGGGNSAMESAEALSHVAKKVFIVHRRDQFRAEQITMVKLKGALNIEWLTGAEVKKILGPTKVKSVEIIFKDGGKRVINCQAVFIHIGYSAKNDWLNGLVALNEKNEVIINEHNETSLAGVFAAGDATTIGYKQVVISAGEGAKAGIRCFQYLQKKLGTGLPALPDWGIKKRK